MTTDKELTLPKAATVWANDLQWSWINTEIAKKEAERLGKDPIHYACTVVPIPPLVRSTPQKQGAADCAEAHLASEICRVDSRCWLPSSKSSTRKWTVVIIPLLGRKNP